MDPDANLARTRELTAAILDSEQEIRSATDAMEELAALVQSLDEWICNGGALPKAWRLRAVMLGAYDAEAGR